MKKDVGNQMHFSSQWWKKNKAKTVKDNGLFAALAAWEKETKDFGVDTLTHDSYARAVAATNAVGVAAKATLDGMGKLADKVATGTKNHLNEYPAQIQTYKNYFKQWKDQYDKNLKRFQDRYTTVLGEIRSSELESVQVDKQLKKLKGEIDAALKQGALDAKAKSDFRGKINGLPSDYADLRIAAQTAEKTAKDLDLNIPPSFNKDTNSKLGALTYDSINKVHASVKIGELALSTMAKLIK